MALGVALLAACAPPDAGRQDRLAAEYVRLVGAEDARPDEGDELRVLTDATESASALLRQTAVRALGRFERPELVDRIAPLLDDGSPAVRAEAANAMAQAVHRVDGDAVTTRLADRVRTETDTLVVAALARSIGRTATSPSARARASDLLLQISRRPSVNGSARALRGVALGWESLVRGAGGQGLGASAADRLTQLATGGGGPAMGPDHARVRALAYTTLGQARRADRTLLSRMLDDPDPFVRLLAGRYLDGTTPEQRPELIRRLLMDRTAAVTIEGFLRLAREPRTALYCRYLLAGASSVVAAPIRVVALDALARPCPDRGPQIDTLSAVAASIAPVPADGWQPAAHALTSLARVAPSEAEPLLPAYTGHADPFVRAYAARAAATLRDHATLRSLAADGSANVRTAAIEGLADLDGHAVDDLLLAQLSSDDPQLIMTAARLLEGSGLGAAATARLMEAFERVSAAERETWRDPRRALLERIAELGDASLAARLEPYLTDYDSSIATQAAALLAEWTGRSYVAAPRPLPREPVPTPAEYRVLDGARVVLSMRGGGEIVIELWPFLATTNVFRFARLAEEGWFDGLTFHRWAPNFVIQGGSPGANEYQGAGRYSRDEVGLQSHWRGTVGISTRGRDTGDAQIFVNLVDNVRLDHDYTIVGRVVEGMDVVDAVLEGSVIERAEVLAPRMSDR